MVLDEATANLDPATEALIQEVLANDFADSSVLTVAHRLDTVIESDCVLVLQGGTIREMGAPYQLLADPSSHFASMAKALGPRKAEQLHARAKKAYA